MAGLGRMTTSLKMSFVRCLAIVLLSLPYALPFSSVPWPLLLLSQGKVCKTVSITFKAGRVP
eukprot:1021227-Rhodomonas_salina.1